jgi:hypothetical protein
MPPGGAQALFPGQELPASSQAERNPQKALPK